MGLFEQIIEIIENEMEEPLEDGKKISLDDNLFDDLHLDSLNTIVIVNEIEEKFNITLNTDELANIKTVRDIEEMVKTYLEK